METLVDLLAAAPLFLGVSRDELAACVSEGREVHLPAGEILLDPARPNSDIFIVLDGQVLVCLAPDPASPIAQLGAGDCVGELSIIDDQLPSAYILAATACRFLAIPQSVLWQLFRRQHAAALNLLRILAQRIRENNAVIHAGLELRRDQVRAVETDELTGLSTRAWADDVLPRQLDLCERTGQAASLLVLDIDYFARLNEFYGDPAGDEALRHVGRLVRRNLRGNDLGARFGGDEVMILMPATEAARARLMAERVRAAIAGAAMQLPDGLALPLTVSGGIAQWRPGQSYGELCEAAAAALRKAKAGGRNQVAVAA